MHTRKDKATEREEKVSQRTSKRASMRTHTRRKMEREKDAYRKGLSVTLTLELSVIYELSAELYMNSLPSCKAYIHPDLHTDARREQATCAERFKRDDFFVILVPQHEHASR